MKKSLIALLACLMLLMGLLTGCAEEPEGSDDPRGFIGYSWKVEQMVSEEQSTPLGKVVAMRFYPDGTLKFKALGVPLATTAWTADMTQMRIELGDSLELKLYYTVEGRSLTLTDGRTTLYLIR